MTSRERVRRALNRQSVDRIPNGLGGSETSGMHLLAYDKLKKIMGIESRKNRMSTFLATSIFEPEVLDAIQGDMILLGTKHSPAQFWGPQSNNAWKDQMLWGKSFQVAECWQFTEMQDGGIRFGTDFICPPGAIYFDSIPAASDHAFLSLQQNPISAEAFHPSGDLPDETLRRLEESARWLYENTEYAIVCGEVIQDFQVIYQLPGGAMGWWMLMASEPAAAHEILHKACQASVSQFRLLNEAIGKYTDMIMICDDIGDRRGVTIGTELWREICKPHYKELFSSWHSASRMKICLHSCGSVRDIMDDLIECGVDVLNPVQISTNGMIPAELKKYYGDRVIFYGGAYDAVLNPADSSADSVYENVKANIEVFGKGGGYIFAGVHNIPGDVPETHLEAIIRAYRDSCAAM